MKNGMLRLAGLVGMIGVLVAGSAMAQTKPASMSAVESNRARFRMFFEQVVNKNDMTKFDEFVAKDMTDHQVAPGYTPDHAGVKKFFTDMLTAFPDMKTTIDVIVAEGDMVAAQVTWTGTSKGPFMGAEATGKVVTFKGIDIVRIKDGKAVEHWGVSDDLALLTQLGKVHMAH